MCRRYGGVAAGAFLPHEPRARFTRASSAFSRCRASTCLPGRCPEKGGTLDTAAGHEYMSASGRGSAQRAEIFETCKKRHCPESSHPHLERHRTASLHRRGGIDTLVDDAGARDVGGFTSRQVSTEAVGMPTLINYVPTGRLYVSQGTGHGGPRVLRLGKLTSVLSPGNLVIHRRFVPGLA